MKTKTESTQPASVDTEAPISLVPPPTEAERLTEATTEIARLVAEREANATRQTALLAKLRELETNPFAFALSNIDAGAVLVEAGEQLKALCATVQRRQEKGSFTLKLAVKPFKAALVLTGDVKIVEPKPEPAMSIFYASEDGTLRRNDPNQKHFNFSQGDRSDGDDTAHNDEENS